MRLLALFCVALGLTGCYAGPNARVNTYTTFGEFQPNETDRVKREFTASFALPPPNYDVTILNSSFPPGVTIVDGHLMAAPDAPYQPIADFQIAFRLDMTAPSQSELTPYLQRLAKVAHANMLVISIHQRVDVPEKIDWVDGVALKSKVASEAPTPPVVFAGPPGQSL